ncbi:MAG: sensor histidine kinase [Chloroflexota bacterium]
MSETPTETDARQVLRELAETERTKLDRLYQRDLREIWPIDYPQMDPRMIGRIAAQEVNALLHFLGNAPIPGREHGAWLSQTGIGHQTLLQLGKATRQFVATRVKGDLLPDALNLVDQYEEAVCLGFIQAREQALRVEQDCLRRMRQSQPLDDADGKADPQRFLARIGHKIRTPLGAMMGLTEMLHEDVYGSLNERQRNLTGRILDNAAILNRMVSEILDRFQFEAGRLRLEQETFAPSAIVEAVYSTALSAALQKEIFLHKEIAANAPQTVVGDRARVEQILSNLVTNAIQFTHRGGVTIRLDRPTDALWTLRIEDTGVGIAEEDLETIFQPFRQADENASRKERRIGLGLSTAFLLVSAMNGTIHAESRLGRGSTFTVTLPVQPEQQG